ADMLIEGFCDSRGSAKYNRWLGQQRAGSARDYLIRHGVAASRIRTISYGSGRQWCTHSTHPCGRSNRRDHLVSVLLAAGGSH
ncbi:MAG: OmpA family protein, partial [Terriglobales bacterium]